MTYTIEVLFTKRDSVHEIPWIQNGLNQVAMDKADVLHQHGLLMAQLPELVFAILPCPDCNSGLKFLLKIVIINYDWMHRAVSKGEPQNFHGCQILLHPHALVPSCEEIVYFLFRNHVLSFFSATLQDQVSAFIALPAPVNSVRTSYRFIVQVLIGLCKQFMFSIDVVIKCMSDVLQVLFCSTDNIRSEIHNVKMLDWPTLLVVWRTRLKFRFSIFNRTSKLKKQGRIVWYLSAPSLTNKFGACTTFLWIFCRKPGRLEYRITGYHRICRRNHQEPLDIQCDAEVDLTRPFFTEI
mmetsp:Transcript_8514/g.13412  ORF Transcript_8514/g.13412 Transcript_8514/m.13412 type:complete len:295 (+) Transcript_8514:137-1021(+)